MTTDLEARLRDLAIGGHPDERRPRVGDEIFREAADIIAALKAQLAEAIKAGTILYQHSCEPFSDHPLPGWLRDVGSDLRRAAEVLRKMEKTNG